MKRTGERNKFRAGEGESHKQKQGKKKKESKYSVEKSEDLKVG